MLLSRFYPWETAASVFTIDYGKLCRLGYRGILFDIDNTLVLHGADSNQAVDDLLLRLDGLGLQTLLLSNNSEERILRFLHHKDLPYIAEADKPVPAAYLQAVDRLGLAKDQVIVIGDQLFTDVYGANRAGLASIRVDFLRHPGERHFGKRRAAEAFVLWCWRRSPAYRRLGGIEETEKRDSGHA